MGGLAQRSLSVQSRVPGELLLNNTMFREDTPLPLKGRISIFDVFPLIVFGLPE